ncbi:hypothetical protein V7128_01890 [Neobacillus vireti]|uniref:hypothetical protein n=1 Tax=Neobacillus vireti TaxID=220686 RepID=UPI002FFF9246
MIKPKNKEWIVVNHVFYEDSGRIYGYKLRNKGSKHKIISIKTGNELLKKGIIEESLMLELSLCTVPLGFIEDTEGLL